MLTVPSDTREPARASYRALTKRISARQPALPRLITGSLQRGLEECPGCPRADADDDEPGEFRCGPPDVCAGDFGRDANVREDLGHGSQISIRALRLKEHVSTLIH